MPSTGISHPLIDDNSQNDPSWYTLSGMKMMKKPSQAGIYIHQGKKQVIR